MLVSTPYMGGKGHLWSKFVSNTNAFLSKGITLQNIWDKMKLETSDHYDLGLKIKRRQLEREAYASELAQLLVGSVVCAPIYLLVIRRICAAFVVLETI